MRMLKVGIALVGGAAGCKIESTLEVEDDATQSDIEESVHEWAMDHVEYWSLEQ